MFVHVTEVAGVLHVICMLSTLGIGVGKMGPAPFFPSECVDSHCSGIYWSKNHNSSILFCGNSL